MWARDSPSRREIPSRGGVTDATLPSDALAEPPARRVRVLGGHWHFKPALTGWRGYETRLPVTLDAGQRPALPLPVIVSPSRTIV
jgi:hypothetical protein